MTFSKPVAVAVLAFLVMTPHGPATAQTPTPPTFAVGTGSVAVDVVVRDKKGQLVKDLKQSDFLLFEDGKPQQVASFMVIARGVEALPAEPTVSRPESKPPAPMTGEPVAAPPTQTSEADSPAVIAFVFDRMGVEGRDMASKAAQTYLSARRDGDFVAVFSIDLALHVVQNFTSDPDRIKSAFERAKTTVNTGQTSGRDDSIALQTLENRAQDAENALLANAGPGSATGGGAQLASGAAAERDMMRLTANMSRSFELLERDQQGYATTNSLLALVSGMQRVPGRKTIVLFSQGIPITTRVQGQFQSVIHAANRANVSLYTMDAAGLRATSENDETRRAMAASSEKRSRNWGREDDLGIMTREAEANEDLMRLNPKAGLAQLANQTGGFMIENTNDARAGFRQIAQDMRFHYVLGYSPTNENYDGRFRSITLKINRPGVEIHWRRGYFAIKPGETSPIRPYEAPAVALLDKAGLAPGAFALRAATLVFPDRTDTSKVPVVVQVPGQALKYGPNPQEKNTQSADLAIVVRIKNEYQQEVSRLSQRFQLTAASGKLKEAQAGDVLFYRQANLAPGKYTVEAIAYDALAMASSVKRFPLEVPGPASDGALLSSLVLISRFEKVPAADRDPENPLYYGDALVYPNMGEPFPKASTKALGFFFTALRPGTKKAVLELRKDGQPLGQLPLDLPDPDAKGMVQNAGALPLASFAPGSYELRLFLGSAAQHGATRVATFTVTE